MTRANIADAENAATKLWLSGGADNFSIGAVAMALFLTKVEKHNEINSLMVRSDRRLEGEPRRDGEATSHSAAQETDAGRPRLVAKTTRLRDQEHPKFVSDSHASCAAARRPARAICASPGLARSRKISDGFTVPVRRDEAARWIGRRLTLGWGDVDIKIVVTKPKASPFKTSAVKDKMWSHHSNRRWSS